MSVWGNFLNFINIQITVHNNIYKKKTTQTVYLILNLTLLKKKLVN
jgi:hypothetical protein